MLLDQRLLESRGDAIAAKSVLLLVVLCALVLCPLHAQQISDADRLIASFRSDWPDLYMRLIALERAHGVFYGAIASGTPEGVPYGGVPYGGVPRVRDEADVFRHLTATATSSDAEADKGYASLGSRGAEIIRRTHQFHREVLAIFAEVAAADRARALDAAVDRYRSRRDVALPDVPKDMTILYDHPYTSFKDDNFNPRRERPYPSLVGFVWASHWFQLAVQEPLELSDRTARADGLKVVTARFERKLSGGKPPDSFPTELPLAPSISPGLVSLHPRAAAILDNLNMMHDVLADILLHPKVADRRAAIEQAIAQATDPRDRIVEVDDWITMALRHSIFQQGGPALGTMTADERNISGHAQHSRSARTMPPRMQ